MSSPATTLPETTATVSTELDRFVKYLTIGLQLGLLAVVFRQFQLESGAFLRVALLAFAGFAIHYYLPRRLQLPFFVALCFTGIGLVFGIVDGAWLVLIGLLLIGICHLPIPFVARVASLVIAGGTLAVMRVEWLPFPWSHAIWPILGSMFMFRLMVYVYDLRHEVAQFSLSRTLAYFFLLPNTCFPLFPVVDYKSFKRTYYNDDEYKIYQTGVDWMVRGVTHLILYRVIYYYGTLAPSEVVDTGDLIQYLTTNFLLYLRVSGQFHLIIGMLHLFGFNLLETNHRYLLASSFTDFWRRINIYWKDFMMKVFYYPVYFRLRSLGLVTAMVFSTIFVFLLTWLLHSYQWFWLRGTFPFIWQDVVFWSVLAALVVFNSLYELRYGRKRSINAAAWTLRGCLTRATRTVGVFLTICVLWSLWTAESFADWLSLWDAMTLELSVGADALPTLLVAATLFSQGLPGRSMSTNLSNLIDKPTAKTVVLVAALALVGIPAIYTQFGPKAATVINTLRSDQLSRLDRAALQKGYYEDLMRVNRFNSQLWEVYMHKPLRWLDVQGTDLKKFTGDLLQFELLPSTESNTVFGAMRTNRWGMRDQEYELTPTPGTYRIALLGASSVMGWGVRDNETFEGILETRLNKEFGASSRFEILNFAVPDYSPIHQLVVVEKALNFGSDAVYYVAGGREQSRAANYLAELTTQGVDLSYDFLREFASQAGVTPELAETAAQRQLAPYANRVTGRIYQEIVRQCRERDARPVWIFLPQVTMGTWQEETAAAVELAREAGFEIVDLSDIYSGVELEAIRIAEWDDHPNAKGHAVIAERLFVELVDKHILPINQQALEN